MRGARAGTRARSRRCPMRARARARNRGTRCGAGGAGKRDPPKPKGVALARTPPFPLTTKRITIKSGIIKTLCEDLP